MPVPLAVVTMILMIMSATGQHNCQQLLPQQVAKPASSTAADTEATAGAEAATAAGVAVPGSWPLQEANLLEVRV